jgi:hypothetical protein
MYSNVTVKVYPGASAAGDPRKERFHLSSVKG